jgi:hypothetical protein
MAAIGGQLTASPSPSQSERLHPDSIALPSARAALEVPKAGLCGCRPGVEVPISVAKPPAPMGRTSIVPILPTLALLVQDPMRLCPSRQPAHLPDAPEEGNNQELRANALLLNQQQISS